MLMDMLQCPICPMANQNPNHHMPGTICICMRIINEKNCVCLHVYVNAHPSEPLKKLKSCLTCITPLVNLCYPMFLLFIYVIVCKYNLQFFVGYSRPLYS